MQEIRVRGLVVPTDWYNGGEIKSICISCAAEEEYQIIEDDVGAELVHLAGHTVEVYGTVSSLEPNTLALRVTKYKAFKPIAPPFSHSWMFSDTTDSELR